MTINSTLGFVEIFGKQDLDMNMEYFLRIPLSMVTQVGMTKLFGRRNTDVEKEDEIQVRNDGKRVRFINLKLSGKPDNYSISLEKDKNTN